MRSSCLLLSLGLSTFAAARNILVRDPYNQFDVRSEANLPTIKATIQIVTKDAAALDAAVKGLTATNADTQSDIINKALLQLSSDTSAQAKKINASGAVGITEGMGLMSSKAQTEWGTLIKALVDAANSTYFQLVEKKDIIKAGGKVDKVVPGIKAQKQSLLDILSIVPSQIPSSLKSALAGVLKGSTSGVTGEPLNIDNLSSPATLAKYGTLIDDFLDQVIANLKTGGNSFTMPGSLAAPTGMPSLAPSGVAAGAPTPALALPKAVPTPAPVPAKAAPPPAPKPKGGKGPGGMRMRI